MSDATENRPRLMVEDMSFESFLFSEKMYYELATFYRAQANYINAIYYLKKEIQNSESLAYKINLADCYIEQKCFEQALIFINQVLHSIAKNEHFYYVIGILKLECLVNTSQLQEALDFIDEMSKYFTLEEEIYAWKAVAHLKLNELEKAQSCYTQCLLLNSHQEKAWLGIGSVHCLKGDFSLGVACYKKALDLNTKSISAINLINKYKTRITYE